MAQKRMFSLSVTDTDKFLDMSTGAQALYFHLGMHGDDDGFVASPRKIAQVAGCNDDDLRLLAAKGYIIPFKSGIIVLADWKINNTLKSDRYQPTIFIAERSRLTVDSAKRWTLESGMESNWNHHGSNMEPQFSIGEISKGKKNVADKPPRSRFVPPTVEEVSAYCVERQNHVNAVQFHDFYSANGWKQGRGKPIVDWKAAVRTWEQREEQSKPDEKPRYNEVTGQWERSVGHE